MIYLPRAVLRAAFYSGLLTAVATSCGKKSDSGDGPAPAPELTLDAPTIEAGKATISYKSNTPDAHYSCRVDVDGKKGEYEECDPAGLEIKTQAGSSYKVYVKAISKSGQESQVSVRSFTAAGSPTQTGPGQSAADLSQVHTVIINRDAIGEINQQTRALVVRTSSVTLQFGVDGNVPAAELRYECRFGAEPKYSDCNGSSYTFANLTDGQSYSVGVRAVHRVTGQSAAEDSVTFSVAIATLQIPNASDLERATSGRVRLSLAGGCQSYRYFLDQSTAAAALTCQAATLSVNLDSQSLSRGSHSLTIERLAAQGGSQVSLSTSITFCKGACIAQGGQGSGNGGGGSSGDGGFGGSDGVPSWGSSLPLGQGYAVSLPDQMHVTEYSNYYGWDGLSFYQLVTGEDDLYSRIQDCRGRNKVRADYANPSGAVFTYCKTTPNEDEYKAQNGFKLAFNHVELASDMSSVPAGSSSNAPLVTPQGYERLNVSIFDVHFEYQSANSRFLNLCGGRKISWYRIPLVNQYFYWEIPSEAILYVCENDNLGNPVSGQRDQVWRIASFFFVRGAQFDVGTRDSHDCQCYPQSTDREAVEMVYMTNSPLSENQFARQAQGRILEVLQSTRPR